MSTYQRAIFREGTAHQIFLEFRFRAPVSSLPGDAPVDAAVDGGEQLVAFGGRLLRGLHALKAPRSAVDFAPIEGAAGFKAPATQRDLFVWLHGDKRDELFARALQWRVCLRPIADLDHEDHGFRFRDSRDLTGFVDGSANPKGDARQAAALIQGGDQTNGSFVFAQRWVHDLSRLSRLPVVEQQRVIGRTKPDSIELEGDAMPPDSHVSRTDIRRDGEAVKIYRRSCPVGTVRDAGLYFLAFSADPQRFRWLLDSMFGRVGDGLHDHLLHFSRPVTGSFFYAPPRQALLRAFDR